MQYLTKVIEFLQGKKTYLLAVAAICHGLAAGDYQEVWTGLTAITIRAGIAKG